MYNTLVMFGNLIFGNKKLAFKKLITWKIVESNRNCTPLVITIITLFKEGCIAMKSS